VTASRLRLLFSELRRRRVIRVAAMYAVAAWLIIQVADSTFPHLQLPEWLLTAVIVLTLLGFPIVVALAWAFDITAEGVRRTGRADGGTVQAPGPRPLAVYVAAVVLIGFAGMGAYTYLRPAARTLADPRITSIAVLPFADMSAEGDQEYFGDGIAEELLEALARIDGLRVPSRTSSFSFKGKRIDIRAIGDALGVNAVLEGSVRKVGSRVKVTAQLIDVRTDRPLWGETYDRELRDIFAVQEEIARAIVNALGVQLSGHTPLLRRHVNDVTAYDLYMRGRSQLLSRTREATHAAVETFSAALERDPQYALAHAGLALASAELHLRYSAKDDAEDWGRRAMRAAYRALDLDPALGEAHEALAAVFRKTEFDWTRTIEESQRAIALSPVLELPYHYLAGALYHLGLLDEADRALDSAEALNPVGDKVELLRSRGMTALLGGRFAAAMRYFDEAHRRSDYAIADWNLALALFYVGEVERAEEMLRALQESYSVSTAVRAQATLASLLAARNHVAEAREILRVLSAGVYTDHHVAYSMGVAYAQLGAVTEAMAWLRQSVETGFPCYPWFARDPLLEPLRTEPGFTALLARLKDELERSRLEYSAQLTTGERS
jgi:adenylate cyclase